MSRRFQSQDGTLVLLQVPGYGIVLSCGVTVPANGSKGYADGSEFIDLDAAAGGQRWRNDGTNTSSLFVQVMGGIDLSGLVATAAELNRTAHPATRLVASGATLAVTQALHDGKTINLAAAAAVTLPVMTGSGSRFRFVCPQDSTAVTITATAAHLFGGVTVGTDSAFAAGTLFTVGFAANGGGSTVITFDGSTRGGKKGDWVEVEDVATSVGIVRGMLNGSGTEATPFS